MIPLAVFSIDLLSGNLLLLASVLIIVAVLLTKLGSRLGVPSLLIFLILGMVFGEDGIGVRFEQYDIAESIGHFAMTIILFSGGFGTSFKEIRPILGRGVSLATVGVLLTVLFTGLFIFFTGGIDGSTTLISCLLIAAVMGSTDSASVFYVLGSRRVKLRENLAPMLELESGSNDPMAYMLTIILVELMSGRGVSVWAGVLSFFLQIVIGTGVGIGIGFAAVWLIKKIKLSSVSLYSILILSIAFLSNGLSHLIHGNGLLSLYITALILGNKVELANKKDLSKFFDGMTWLMQLVMFLMLGLLARPSQMLPVLGYAILIGLFLMFVARPAAVFISLIPFRGISFKGKLFTSWVGLRGAGPVLFALTPVLAGVENSSALFNIVFVITLFSLILQGTTLQPFAKLLKLSYEDLQEAETFGMEIPEDMGMLRDHIVSGEELAAGSTLRDLALPHGIRVVMVKRDDHFLVPHGSMALQSGDHLLLIIGDTDD